MAALTAGSETLLRSLLAWDRERIGDIEGTGIVCAEYRLRQDVGEAMLSLDVAGWPEEYRELFQVLLEATRTPDTPSAFRVGRVRRRARAPLTRLQRIAYRNAAIEIGVLARLMEVAPHLWAEEP